MSKICPICHKEFSDCENFCSYCGFSLTPLRDAMVAMPKFDERNMEVIYQFRELLDGWGIILIIKTLSEIIQIKETLKKEEI